MGKLLHRFLVIAITFILFGTLLVGCRPAATATPAVASTSPPGPVGGPSPTEGATVNLAAELALEDAVGLEVLRTDLGSESLTYESLGRINDSQTLQGLAEALDQELPLVSRVRCPTVYALRFEYEDGSSIELGYGCDADDPLRLRGDQDFWANSDVEAPESFRDLLAPHLNVAAELPAQLLAVRDRALSYLRERYPAQAPEGELTWSGRRITSEDIVGVEQYRLEAQSWSIEISYPVVAPEKVVYTVEVANDATGFYWKGEIDADGSLTTLQEEPGDKAVMVNPVEALVLDQTESLEIRFAQDDAAGDMHIATIGEADEVAALIAALDAELPLIPRAGGQPAYLLRFVKQDDEPVTLYFGCDVWNPLRLRGDQALWQGRDVEVPEAFRDLVMDYLTVDQPVPEEVGAVRDRVLDYLRDAYPANAPAEGLNWEGKSTRPVGILGSERFAFTSNGWKVEVSYPLAGPGQVSYTINVRDKVSGFHWRGEIGADDQLQTLKGPNSTQAVAGWYGRVERGGGDEACSFYLTLETEGQPRVGLEASDSDLVQQLRALTEQGEALRAAHLWGDLICETEDAETCRIKVGRLRPEGAGAVLEESVAGWEGVIVSNGKGAQYDDYLLVTGLLSMRYGLASGDAEIEAQIEDLRDTLTPVRIWGTLRCGVMDVNGTQLDVERLELIGEPLAPTPTPGPHAAERQIFTHPQLGYQVSYPAGYLPTVSMDGALLALTADDEAQAWFYVLQRDEEAYQPPEGADLRQWLLAQQLATEACESGPAIDGYPSVHWRAEDSGRDDYFVAVEGRLYRLSVVLRAGQVDAQTIVRFLEGVRFGEEEGGYLSAGEVSGWIGHMIKLPAGNQHGDYFLRQDGRCFDVGGNEAAVQEVLRDAAWSGALLKVWGQLQTAEPPVSPGHIQVLRVETVSAGGGQARDLTAYAAAGASSALPSDGVGTYHAWSAIDGDRGTAWAEAASGSGQGEWLMLEFSDPICVQAIGLDVGYDRSAELFAANHRVASVRLLFSTGDELVFDWADVRDMQYVRLAEGVETRFVKVIVEGVYAGYVYDDACIGEIEVWGAPVG